MRILNTAALLAVLAASATAQVQPPLEASLRRGASEPLFSVNQAAYVAVYEVIPGAGVQQVFPRSASQASQPVEPGEYMVSRPFRSQLGISGGSAATPDARPMYMLDGRGRIICPRGYYTVPAQFFFETGMFSCQAAHSLTDQQAPVPVGPPPTDTVTTEKVQLPARKVPPRFEVEEGAVQLRGGVRTTTPVLSQPQQVEEAYRPYRRGGGEVDEGFRAFGRGSGTTEATRATIIVGAPIVPEGTQAARLIPSTGAWVPPIPGASSNEYGYGSGRFFPSGSAGYGGTWSGTTAKGSGGGSSSTDARTGSASSPSAVASPSPPSSQSASQAQAERSAASRAEVSAARAAATKPTPDPR